jgi:hypothetical protein
MKEGLGSLLPTEWRRSYPGAKQAQHHIIIISIILIATFTVRPYHPHHHPILSLFQNSKNSNKCYIIRGERSSRSRGNRISPAASNIQPTNPIYIPPSFILFYSSSPSDRQTDTQCERQILTPSSRHFLCQAYVPYHHSIPNSNPIHNIMQAAGAKSKNICRNRKLLCAQE